MAISPDGTLAYVIDGGPDEIAKDPPASAEEVGEVKRGQVRSGEVGDVRGNERSGKVRGEDRRTVVCARRANHRPNSTGRSPSPPGRVRFASSSRFAFSSLSRLASVEGNLLQF